MSFREWYVDEGEVEGVSLEKAKRIPTTERERKRKRIPMESWDLFNFINNIIHPA